MTQLPPSDASGALLPATLPSLSAHPARTSERQRDSFLPLLGTNHPVCQTRVGFERRIIQRGEVRFLHCWVPGIDGAHRTVHEKKIRFPIVRPPDEPLLLG